MDDSETTESTKSTDPTPNRDRVNRAIKKARKAAGRDFDENPEQVKFLIEEARILATLEVADAVRGDQNHAGS